MLRKWTHVIPCGKFDHKSALVHSMTSTTLVPQYVYFFLFYPTFSAKPLPEPMPTSCLLNPLDNIQWNLNQNSDICFVKMSLTCYTECWIAQSVCESESNNMQIIIRSGARLAKDIQSNSKFDLNLECPGLKCTPPITAKFCTHHDSVTVVTCAKFRCDQLSIS